MSPRRGRERGNAPAEEETTEKPVPETERGLTTAEASVSVFGVKKEAKPSAPSVLDTISPERRVDLARYAVTLSEHVQSIPNRERILLITGLMQDYMAEAANKAAGGDTSALTRLGKEIADLEAEDPSLRFILDFYLHQLALAHGQRLVDSKLIDESIRKLRADAQRSWWKRLTSNGKRDLAIIKEMEETQARLEAERGKLNELLAEIQKVRAEKDALRDRMQAEAKEIIARAEREAEATRKRAEEERTKVVGEAKTEAKEIKDNAKDEAAKTEATVAKRVDTEKATMKELERKKTQLQIEVAQLESVKKELAADPNVAKVNEERHGREVMRQDLLREIEVVLEKFLEENRNTRGSKEEIQGILSKYDRLSDRDKISILRGLRFGMIKNNPVTLQSFERWFKEIIREPTKMYEAQNQFPFTDTLTATTPEGREIALDLKKELTYWTKFYTDHHIDWVTMPETISLKPDQITRMQELMTQGFDKLLIVPANLVPEPTITTDPKTKKKTIRNPHYTRLHQLMSQGYTDTFQGDNYKADGGLAGSQDKSTQLRLILTKDVQNIEDAPLFKATLNKSLEDLEKDELTNYTGLSESAYLIYQREYFERTTKHLDEKQVTWLPESPRPLSGRVASACWGPVRGRLSFSSDARDGRDDGLGCRLAGSFPLTF